jgi:N-acetylglucosaminyldiphosphoundecaprenol N-acetyl-beta-D-mannosaminyltransferase
VGVNFHRDVHCLLGVPFDAVDMPAALRRVRDAAAERASCFICTPNVNFLIGCHKDGRFRDSVVRSDLSIADGMPVVWIARLLGIPIRTRVSGSSLFEKLREAKERPLSVYFFGGPDGTAAAASRRLHGENAGLTCAGHQSPGFGSVDELSGEETIQRINASGADFLVVSLGAKKGQEWIERNRNRLSVPVVSHLGAALHFTAGTLERAPLWMQNAGLEWLWRIKEEPGLWRRYLSDALGLLTLLVTRVLPHYWYLQRRKVDSGELAAAEIRTSEDRRRFMVRLSGAWTRDNVAPLREIFAKAAQSGKDIALEMRNVVYVDSAFVGLAMLLHENQTRHGREFAMREVPAAVRRFMTYCCAEYLLATAPDRSEPEIDVDTLEVSEGIGSRTS